MFRPRVGLPSTSVGSGSQRSNVNCLPLSPFAATLTRIQSLRKNTPPVSPFLAALTDTTQLHENKTPLTLVFATLTRLVTHNPFVCHSYEKHPEWGVPASNKTPQSPFPCSAWSEAACSSTLHGFRNPVSAASSLSTFNCRLPTLQVQSPHLIQGDR